MSVDEGPEAPTLLAVAAEMAQRQEAPLSAVTVGGGGAPQGGAPWLSDLTRTVRSKHPHLQCATFTLKGMPANKITEAAHGARLLVIGARRLSGIPGIVRGSVSQAILENTDAPVLVVPSRSPSHKDR